METTPNNIGTGWFSLLKPADGGSKPGLAAVIERTRRRWRLRLLLEGLFRAVAFATVVFLLAAWLLNQWHFAPAAVWTLRILVLFALVTLFLYYCARPLRQRVDDLRVALYLEEHEPGLKSILLSAVDARKAGTSELSPQLVERLETRALVACEQIEFGDRVEGDRIRKAAWKLVPLLLLITVLAASPPAFLRSSAPALAQAWTNTAEVSPYRIELEPGDIEIARASDQLIVAGIHGFDGGDVLLFTSVDDGASWRQTTMASTSETGRYQSFLFDINADTDYYVTGAGRQTPAYRISVTDIPAIESIGLRYHFPPYTMLPPETTEGSGDISALRGTRVEVLIKPTVDIPGGALMLDDGRRLELKRADEGRWVGELTVTRDETYRVTLQRASGAPVDSATEYRVTALDDGFPSVSILSPGRDTRVSMIEEPVLKVRARDDQGIARLELVVSVNGEDAKRIGLMPAEPAAGSMQQVEAEHIVYLEELGLRPGDLISYYVRAEDRAAGDDKRVATSDIFFYQVRPFSNNYRRAAQQAGGGGQGGQQRGHLSEQQKQFVVATFKMIRDRARISAETWQENLDLLITAQSRIRDRVEAIVRRIESRPMIQADKRYRIILEELPAAAEAMVAVEQKLGETEVEAALTDAQVALKHLQRADAEFRDINVSLSNRGGGGGSASGFEDLANLFQLEMDKLRHQYDTVQRAQQQPSPNEVIDETLEKLRELARRQQQQVERQMQRQGQSQDGAANRQQLEIAEQLEAMARQLERLSRKLPNPQLQQSIEQMKQAAAAMRRAASSATAGGAGGIEQARQAAENLRSAGRLLDRGRVRQFSEQVERSLRRAELVEKKQAAIKRDVAELETNWGDELQAQMQRLQQKKQALAEELTNLEGELSSLMTKANEDQPEAGQSLKQAIRASREHRLHDRIGRTRQMLMLSERAAALDNETEILKGAARMREHIESALHNIDRRGSGRMQRSLEQLRDLARELRHLREHAAAAGAGSGGNADGSNRWNPGAPIGPEALESLAQRVRALGQDLREQEVPAGDIDPVLDSMENLAKSRSEKEIPAQNLALRALMELEFKLRGQVDESEYPEYLISEPADIADDYRQMVADYFRELSRQ